jgi:uncharacterized membrane protein (DUF106 family)
MAGDDREQLLDLLREIRDGQRLALERQAQALELQRSQMELVRQQAERSERIQERAERLQDRGAAMMRAARIATGVITAIVVLLVLFLGWLLFR